MSKIGGNIMHCKNCGKEIDKKAVVCTGCGCKIKKPAYKRWWFWVVVLIILAIIGSTSEDNETPSNSTAPLSKRVEEVVYEVVDLQTMFDDLDENAMKAEKTYQKKYVEFECKITSFDSAGDYIDVEPVNASEWNFTTATCYIKNNAQKEVLMQKSVGDSVTIKGKIKSIGEFWGYSIDIKEIY